MGTPLKHGVVVVHGQVGPGQVCGEQLALVANGIADTLENAGARVERTFLVEDGRATGSLVVTQPGTSDPEDEFRFVEAFWADSLPAAPADVVARWILRRAPREAVSVIRGFWRNIANDHIDDGRSSDYPARGWIKLTFTLELAVVTAFVMLAAAISVVLSPLVYALYSLAGAGRSQAGGFLSSTFSALHKLDPFLSAVLGDTWRFVEDGMWSVNIREVVERAITEFYVDPEIADITIIAHSAGCGVAYAALALGRPPAEAAASASPPKRLTLVTAGSAMNRYYALSKSSKTSPYTRRLSTEPLDPRVTGRNLSAAPAQAAKDAKEIAALQSRFYWLDLYARMDLVPGGGMSNDVVRMAGIDPCQLKCRPVMNEDSLIHDHFTYFTNTDLVTPRLIRAIYGGIYPWQGTDRLNTPAITRDRVSHRTRAVAALQAVRMTLYGCIAAYAVFFLASQAFRDWAAKDAGAVINLDLGRFGELITLALVLIGPIVLASYVYNWIRGWWFDSI